MIHVQKTKTHTPAFKAKLALESIQGLKTASEIASEHGIHISQLQKWKKHLLENVTSLFEDGVLTDPHEAARFVNGVLTRTPSGRQRQRLRSERVERSFAHTCESGVPDAVICGGWSRFASGTLCRRRGTWGWR